MSRCDDATGGDVVASVATVIGQVADEDTWCRAWSKLVCRDGDQVGEAPTPKHTEFVVGRRYAEEECVRCSGGGSTTRASLIRYVAVVRASAQNSKGAAL